MGESTCFMQPFSYTIPIEANNNQGNPVYALGESISFGRFTTESLSWEKWSTFSHKRYVEEAERYAQPGSVAQKKAFFEAHYRRIAAKKAAALLEEANASVNNPKPELEVRVCKNDTCSGTDDSHMIMKSHDSLIMMSTSEKVMNEGHKMKEDINSAYSSASNPVELEIDKVITADRVLVNEPRVESPIETENLNDFASVEDLSMPSASEDSGVSQMEKPLLEFDKMIVADNILVNEPRAESSIETKKSKISTDVGDLSMVSTSEDSGTSQMEKPLLQPKLIADQDVSFPIMKKKPAFSSSSSSIYRRTYKAPPSPIKSVASTHPRKENMVTPRANIPTIHSVKEKRTTPKALHASINYTPVREPNKLMLPAVQKMETASSAAIAFKPSKQYATPLRTPTKAPAKGVNKKSLTTPSVEKTRLEKTPLHPSATGSKTSGPKWHILSAVSKSFTACKNKLQSPTVSTPFTLRTEERATRRKQKLEEKFNDKEEQKVQLQTKLKEKAENEFSRRLRQSLCFKARPLPEFYRERETPKRQIIMTPLANPASLTPGRKPHSMMKPSTRTNISKNEWKKNGANAARSLASVSEMLTRENRSPNIQI